MSNSTITSSPWTPEGRSEFGKFSPPLSRNRAASTSSPRSAEGAVRDKETISTLRRELKERAAEVEEQDARYEAQVTALHQQLEGLEAQLKQAKTGEAEQSRVWREKATVMVEKLTADAREETDFWKNKSSDTIEKVTKKMQEAYTARARQAATRWIIGFTRSIFRALLGEQHIECFMRWMENVDDWRRAEEKKKQSLRLLRVLHHFLVGVEGTKQVIRRLLSQWRHMEVREAINKLHSMQEERAGLQKAVVVLKGECSRLAQKALEAANAVPETVVKEVVRTVVKEVEVPAVSQEDPAQALSPAPSTLAPRSSHIPPATHPFITYPGVP